jgi:hypothetical protein
VPLQAAAGFGVLTSLVFDRDAARASMLHVASDCVASDTSPTGSHEVHRITVPDDAQGCGDPLAKPGLVRTPRDG